MRIFLTGGTGYVGDEVLRQLIEAGHEVIALARRPAARAGLKSLGAKVVLGRLESPSDYVAVARAADSIVHCALDYGADGSEGLETDRIALDALLRAVDPGGQLVYTSNLFDLDTRGLDRADEENTLERSRGWRSQQERAVLESPGGVVIRLGFVYGGTRGGYVWEMLAPTDRGTIPYVGGAHRWPFVEAVDLARLFLAIVESRATGLFHGCDGVPISVDQTVETVARLVGAIPQATNDEVGGPLSKLMERDIPAIARRSLALGWRPKVGSFSLGARQAHMSWLEGRSSGGVS